MKVGEWRGALEVGIGLGITLDTYVPSEFRMFLFISSALG